MIDITFLITILKMKNSTLIPFTFKLTDLAENIRGQGPVKWLVSISVTDLRNG